MESLKVPSSEGECLQGCQSTQHGGVLSAALSMRGVDGAATIAFLRWQCCNCGQVVDSLGRSALHLAASCGWGETARWLVRHCGASVNLRDAESGYTPLHRSIFYGQIHVATSLIRLGASVACLDYDDLTALDHAMKDRMPYVEFSLGNPCEVYSWGNNSNYTLGVGNQRTAPELVDCFRKQSISIRQVAMNKFHSVFVSHGGRAFSCGHGQGGRLGLGGEQAALQPAPMRLPEEARVAAAALGRDHSVLLLADGGGVWTCGLNAHHQLGHAPPPPALATPRPLPQRALRPVGTVQGVCAGRFHTVVWGPKGVMTCGLHAGQLGHAKDPELLQTAPRLVAAVSRKEAAVTHAAASDGATVVATSKGDIYALHEYQCRKVASRLLDIVKVEVVGGHLDSRMDASTLVDRGGDQLKVAALTSTGKLLLWQENSQQMLRCVFSLNRPLVVTDVALCRSNSVLLATRDGEAFEGEIKVRKPKKAPGASPVSNAGPAFHEFLEKSDCEQVKVKRLLHIHRAVSVSCDPKGRDFAVVQTHPQAALVAIPSVDTSEAREQMRVLLADACTEDSVHDVVFVVGAREFPAHRYVVASQSEPLAKMMESKIVESDETPRVKVNNVKPDVFEQILQFIYTGECDMLKSGICSIQGSGGDTKENEDTIDINSVSAFAVYSGEISNKKVKNKQLPKKQNHDSKKQNNDPVKILQDSARRFGLVSLQKMLDNIKCENDRIKTEGRIRPVKVKFDRKNLQDLYDVTVRSETGTEVKAHKCILTARLDYFNSMINHGWLESSQTSKLQLPIPHKVLEILIDFLYVDESSLVQESDDLDLVFNILVMSDQFFVTRLKEICEVTLAGLITLRNAAKVLQIADTYNANQLKQSCMQYICLNLSAILEMRGLEYVSDSVLQELSKYYQDFNPSMSKRVITPYSDAPSQSLVEAVAEAYPVKFGEDDDECDIIESSVKKNVKTAKKKVRIRKISVNDSNRVNERMRNESLSSNQSNISDDDEKHSLNFTDLVARPSSEDVTLELTKLQLNSSSQEADSKWDIVKDNKKKHMKSLQARLKSITSVKDDPSVLSQQDNWTTLSKRSLKSAPTQTQPSAPASSSPHPVPQSSLQPPTPAVPYSLPPDLVSDFPELNSSSPSLHDTHHKTPHKTPEVKHLTKVSQKQRKKMAAELADQTEKGVREPQRLAWGLSSKPSSSSFLDIMHEETCQSELSTGTTALNDPVSGPSKGSPPSKESPPAATNPWIKMQKSPVGSPESTVQFCNIIADERKLRTNWTKMLAKPLELTQLEDRAIEDLLLFYNASSASDERITVRRVITDSVATPTWITSRH